VFGCGAANIPRTARLHLPTLNGFSSWCLYDGDLHLYDFVQVALVRVLGLDLGTTLIFTGLYNIASGALFGIPMPVQPMKAIAAIALADQHLSLAHIVAAGVFVSACTFILGVTRLINVFNW